jgi:hypothetical protein
MVMKRQISVADVQGALDGFVQAGLACVHSVPEPSKWQFAARQRRLIKTVIEKFCPCFVPGGTVVYIGDAEDKFLHLDVEYLQRLGVVIPAPAKMPDVVVHDAMRNWLVLIEAVISAGPVDGKRRKELKQLFAGCKAGLIFVTAFSTRDAMRSFLTQISWETEVWVAEDPAHMIHFDGERFPGPYSSSLWSAPSRFVVLPLCSLRPAKVRFVIRDFNSPTASALTGSFSKCSQDTSCSLVCTGFRRQYRANSTSDGDTDLLSILGISCCTALTKRAKGFS